MFKVDFTNKLVKVDCVWAQVYLIRYLFGIWKLTEINLQLACIYYTSLSKHSRNQQIILQRSYMTHFTFLISWKTYSLTIFWVSSLSGRCFFFRARVWPTYMCRYTHLWDNVETILTFFFFNIKTTWLSKIFK